MPGHGLGPGNRVPRQGSGLQLGFFGKLFLVCFRELVFVSKKLPKIDPKATQNGSRSQACFACLFLVALGCFLNSPKAIHGGPNLLKIQFCCALRFRSTNVFYSIKSVFACWFMENMQNFIFRWFLQCFCRFRTLRPLPTFLYKAPQTVCILLLKIYHNMVPNCGSRRLEFSLLYHTLLTLTLHCKTYQKTSKNHIKNYEKSY